jgi:hypothetical protein
MKGKNPKPLKISSEKVKKRVPLSLLTVKVCPL